MSDRILVAKIGWAPRYQGEDISCPFGKKGDDGVWTATTLNITTPPTAPPPKAPAPSADTK